jgi:hypothetical protein
MLILGTPKKRYSHLGIILNYYKITLKLVFELTVDFVEILLFFFVGKPNRDPPTPLV